VLANVMLLTSTYFYNSYIFLNFDILLRPPTGKQCLAYQPWYTYQRL